MQTQPRRPTLGERSVQLVVVEGGTSRTKAAVWGPTINKSAKPLINLWSQRLSPPISPTLTAQLHSSAHRPQNALDQGDSNGTNPIDSGPVTAPSHNACGQMVAPARRLFPAEESDRPPNRTPKTLTEHQQEGEAVNSRDARGGTESLLVEARWVGVADVSTIGTLLERLSG
ncbi:hypothetical protein CCMA1212_007050 [Trichoderma ghanense]|uniref:Uncharacterized protein n=1 Tax=Trichoderma ghanense TaxID=65468 RepID=A0ABY2GZL8_9HYPO